MKKPEAVSHWLYNNKIYNPTLEEQLATDNIGFVYMITNITTGKRYIGKKLIITVKKLPPLKGKKNKRHSKVFTDWKTYMSSSKYIKEDIELLGKDNFKFEILTFHPNKSELNYAELWVQVRYNVLEYNKEGERLWYNENISCKFYSSEKYNQHRLDNFKLYESILQ